MEVVCPIPSSFLLDVLSSQTAQTFAKSTSLVTVLADLGLQSKSTYTFYRLAGVVGGIAVMGSL